MLILSVFKLMESTKHDFVKNILTTYFNIMKVNKTEYVKLQNDAKALIKYYNVREKQQCFIHNQTVLMSQTFSMNHLQLTILNDLFVNWMDLILKFSSLTVFILR